MLLYRDEAIQMSCQSDALTSAAIVMKIIPKDTV